MYGTIILCQKHIQDLENQTLGHCMLLLFFQIDMMSVKLPSKYLQEYLQMGAVFSTWARESAPNPRSWATVNVDSGQNVKKKEQIAHHQGRHLHLVPLPQDILEGSENSLKKETEFKYYRIRSSAMETLSSRYEMATALTIQAVVTYTDLCKNKLSKITAKMGTTMFRPHS